MTHRVSCGLLVRDDRVLLALRSVAKSWYPSVWDLPGGHVEPGESSAHALVRELREELAVELAEPLGPPFATVTRPGLVLDVWRVIGWTGVPLNAAPHEHDELRWSTVEEAGILPLADDSYLPLLARAVTWAAGQ
jgi:8-oxo-dGTP diphosphatase